MKSVVIVKILVGWWLYLAAAAVQAEGVPTESSSVAAKVSVGDFHTCALTTGGAVMCWGSNDKGQIGDGTTTNRARPVLVGGMESDVVDISTGDSHSCALKSSGEIYCWGQNSNGQLGDGTSINRSMPVKVNTTFLIESLALSGGGRHNCAITTDGGVVCWGDNNQGQLGNGSTSTAFFPQIVGGLTSGVRMVSTSDNHSCAVSVSGQAKCWGFNFSGELGDRTVVNRASPVNVFGLSGGVSTISTGGPGNTCALLDSGALRCWGGNRFGQLGIGTTNNSVTSPGGVIGLSGAVDAMATAGHSCAAISNGTMQCWGNNSFGQIGDGTAVNFNTGRNRLNPVDVIGLNSPITMVATGGFHTCALSVDNDLYCWGASRAGQIGSGTTFQKVTADFVVNLGASTAVDSDGDGVVDEDDAFPDDDTETVDSDDDGIGDNADIDDDNDNQTDADELACGSDPLDKNNTSTDQDGDNVPDCVDEDRDGDGVENEDDVFPDDDAESADSDDDGVGDNTDVDDDNDSQTDIDERACGSDPLDRGSVSADFDGDGSPDCIDPDDDNDTVEDFADICPVTEIPESAPTRSLRSNRYVVSDGSGEFESTSSRGYSLADTGGCSCEQILTSSNDERYGCRASTLRRWIRDLPAHASGL